MKKASFLILFITVFLINNTYSQNAIIRNNYVTTKTYDTVCINMNDNNLEPDGEKLKIKRIVKNNELMLYTSILNDSIFQFQAEGVNKNFYIILLIQEIRGNYVLASYNDTLFINLIDNDKASIIEANNIRTVVNPDGLLFNHGSDFAYTPLFNAPRENSFDAIRYSSIFMGGYSNNNKLNTAFIYGNNTNFIYYGISSLDTTMQYQKKYNNTYKLTSDQIENHIRNWKNSNYAIDSTILNWPAHGDTIYKEPYNLFPFEDINNNNKYEPQLGEYPIIKGDEFVLFFNKATNFSNDSSNMKIDIITSIYTYRKNISQNVLNNTIFVNYKLINKSENFYKKFKIGSYISHSFGNMHDDYIGCDTNLNLHFVYNTSNFDYFYQNNSSTLGICILNKKLDSFVFDRFNSMNPSLCEMCDTSYTNNILYNLLYGKRPLGNYQYYGGDGISGHPNVSNQIVKHAFFGDVNDLSQWSERSANLLVCAKTAFISVPEVDNFNPNDTIDIEMAYIFAQDNTLNNFTIVNKLKEDVQDLINFYKVIGKEEITKTENKIKIYPNPSNDKFYFDYGNDNENFNVNIYDISGKLILSKKSVGNNSSIDVNNLKQGIYFVNFSNNKNTYNTKLIKN